MLINGAKLHVMFPWIIQAYGDKVNLIMKTAATLVSIQYIAQQLYKHSQCVREMLRQGSSVGRSLVAGVQQPVLRSVCARVFQRCNSTIAATQARSEEWVYAKPFEDIPGPKPLPIIGNAWRFIPQLGKLLFPHVTRVCSQNERPLARL
jgi:hypothetical protein